MSAARAAAPDPADSNAKRMSKKSTPKLRDGVMKRGNTWSYVIRPRNPFRMPGFTISGTFTPRLCSWPASLFTWSPLGSVTRIRPSRFGSTPT